MIRRIFASIARFSVGHPRAVLGLAVLASAISIVAAARGLELRTSNLDLIDQDLPEVKAFLDFAREFGSPNALVVVLEGDDPGALTAAADRIGPALRNVPGVRDVLDRLPFPREALDELGIDPYVRSRDHGMCFLYVQPDDPYSSADQVEPVVRGVRAVLQQAGLDKEGIRAGTTGIPQYAIDDRDVIQRDITWLSGLSCALVLILFAAAFSSLRGPALAVAALGLGVVITLGVTCVFPGHLTLLSSFFASTLFGLGIDYGIHVIHRMEEFVRGGMDERDATVAAIGALAPELLTGAATTAAAFYAMNAAGFKGFAELGTIAGNGVLICLLMMITALPALLVLAPGRKRRALPPAPRRTALVLGVLQKPWVSGPVAAAALACVFAGGPGFDSDYLNLQPVDSESVRLERAMVERSDISPQFAVFVAGSRDRAAALADRLLDEPTVGDVRSIADLDLLSEGGDGELDVPASFLRAFESERGRFAVYAYPRHDVWGPEHRSAFLDAMRAIAPDVTGMPILGDFMVARTRRALRITALAGGCLLVICVLAGFPRILPALVAMAPTFLTFAGLHAVMKLIGMPFNPINLMALPVIMGIGIDDGVYIVHRYLSERGDVAKTLAATGRSVVLTSLTTMAAFGSLAFTSHRGLASFAVTLTLGVAIALLLSVTVLPLLLNRLKRGLLATPPPISPILETAS